MCFSGKTIDLIARRFGHHFALPKVELAELVPDPKTKKCVVKDYNVFPSTIIVLDFEQFLQKCQS